MSTSRATTQLMKSKETIAEKIEMVKSKAEAKILAYEHEMVSIDKALHALAGDVQVRKAS